MKTLTRVAFSTLAFSLVPFSYSYAQDPVDLAPDIAESGIPSDADVSSDNEEDSDIQAVQDEVISEEKGIPKAPTLEEARAALAMLPGARDATKGRLGGKTNQNIYDIYGRQLAYREGVKEYRKELDERREEFSKPRTKMIGEYQKTRDMIYAAETAEYQKKLNEEKSEKAKVDVHKLPTGEALSAIQDEEVAEALGLKEQEIPSDVSESEAQKVKRKVVTTDDAPVFDPARLNVDEVPKSAPVPVEGVEPPPMPEEAPQEKESAAQATKSVEENAEKTTETAEATPAAEEETQEQMMEEDQENAVIETNVQESDQTSETIETMTEKEAEQTETEVKDSVLIGLPELLEIPEETADVMQEEEPVQEAAEPGVDKLSVHELIEQEADDVLEAEGFNNPFDDEELSDPFDDEKEGEYNYNE